MHLSTPLPGLVGHPAPPLRPQSLRASPQESTGTEDTRGGAGTGQKSVFERSVGGVPTLSHWWSPVPAPSGPAPRQGGAPKCALLSGGAMVQCAGSQKVFACGHWILAGFSRPHHLTTSPLATPVRRIRVWGEFYQSPFEAWAEIICVRRNLAKNTRSPLLTSLLGLQPLVPHHHPQSEYAELQYMSPGAQRYPGHEIRAACEGVHFAGPSQNPTPRRALLRL